MDTFDSEAFRFAIDFRINVAIKADWLIKLRDLIRFWRIRIEIVLPVEFCLISYLAVERHRCTNGEFDGFFVDFRQDARVSKTNRTRFRIRLCAIFPRTTTEHLRVRAQFGVDLDPDDRFKVHDTFAPYNFGSANPPVASSNACAAR